VDDLVLVAVVRHGEQIRRREVVGRGHDHSIGSAWRGWQGTPNDRRGALYGRPLYRMAACADWNRPLRNGVPMAPVLSAPPLTRARHMGRTSPSPPMSHQLGTKCPQKWTLLRGAVGCTLLQGPSPPHRFPGRPPPSAPGGRKAESRRALGAAHRRSRRHSHVLSPLHGTYQPRLVRGSDLTLASIIPAHRPVELHCGTTRLYYRSTRHRWCGWTRLRIGLPLRLPKRLGRARRPSADSCLAPVAAFAAPEIAHAPPDFTRAPPVFWYRVT